MEEDNEDIAPEAPEAWRFGPAKLFYDKLDVPKNPAELDYDYGSLFQPKLEVGVEGSPNAWAGRTRLVESAVGTILPMEEENGKRVTSPKESSPLKWEKSSVKRNQTLDVNENLQTIVEAAAAVSTLMAAKEDEGSDKLAAEKAPDVQHETGTLAPKDEEDRFLLVAQLEWEKDIIWSPEKVPRKISKVKEARAGWIPSATNRSSAGRSLEEAAGNSTSFFSFENMELINGHWEDDVIWDADEFRKQNPQPKFPVYEATNEHFVFNMPKDVPPMMEPSTSASAPSTLKKKLNSHTVKSKLLLGKTGMFLQPFERPQPKSVAIPSHEMSPGFPNFTNDFYNISNDQSYQHIKDNVAVLNLIRFGDISGLHSKLVRSLTSPFLKLNLSKEELRHFHRPQWTNEKNAPVSSDPYNRHFFKSVSNRIQKKALECSKLLGEERPTSMDRPIDLSGRDGEILIVENCEEFPPLLSQVGMCSKIKNFCQRSCSLQDGENVLIPHSYGETTFVHTLPSPYLGSLEQGQIFSSLENNLYCSPIYYHSPCTTDFLVIRNKYFYMIREINASFTAGQQCPLIEVPEPNSAKARSFLKELVKVFIFRKFRNCTGSKRQVNLEKITEIFPTLTESNIRNWMKSAVDLSKMGSSTWVVMKREFKLPTEVELEEMVSPEQCCAYFSMLATEQRLKDNGCNSILLLSELVDWDKEKNDSYSKKKKAPAPDESAGMEICPKKNYSELDKELETAPWNTTSAFIAASNGKCFLQIDGPAEPTGCGEGFSYVRMAKSGSHQLPKEKIKKVSSEKALSRPGGTDADLRRLTTEVAKELLRKAGIPENDIQKLTRWEIIDVVRTLSTEKAKMGDTDDNRISKFSRCNKTGRLMNQARYKKSCQKIFELQNDKLSSAKVLSTDDEDEEENTDRRRWTSDGDIRQIGENIKEILNRDKNIDAQFLHEQEECERVQLQLMMLGKVKAVDAEIALKVEQAEVAEQQKKKKSEMDILKDIISLPGRFLKLQRSFEDDNRRPFTRTEIIRDPLVIAAYVKIRATKNEQFIKDFLKKSDAKEKREKKKELTTEKTLAEKRLECWRRKKKREMEPEYFPNRSTKSLAKRKLKKKKRKCGKCGLRGHIRTSSECPRFRSKTNRRKVKKDRESSVITPE